VKLSLSEIIQKLGGRLEGEDVVVTKLSSLANAASGDISFLSGRKYASDLKKTSASAIVISEPDKSLTTIPKIIVDNPYAYFAQLSSLLNPPTSYKPSIHPSAAVATSAKIHPSCHIGANVVIGEGVNLDEAVVVGANSVIGDNVQIGEKSIIDANCTIYYGCKIGKNCHVFSGAVIGADGFGYAPQDNQWVKIPQIGRVIIADNVDIGANTSIDRGALDDTIIGTGAKLDNQIQIGHNCVIGDHTVIAGCVGIAGSAKIGKHCRIGGAAMILGHLEVADGVTISPGTMITRSIHQQDTYTALMPFMQHNEWLKLAANIRKLSDLSDKVKILEKQLALAQAKVKSEKKE
jgi:UDP-3-O-[3-hydroxymyristoyl] glucosamine N-acyltransferase